MWVTLYIQDSNRNGILLLDVKIEMQKTTEKQFILSIFKHKIFKLIFSEIIDFLRLFASLPQIDYQVIDNLFGLTNMDMCDTFTREGASPYTLSEIQQSPWWEMNKILFLSKENWAKICENEVKNFVESTSKFANKLNKICSVSFVHFCKFLSTKICWKP